MADIGLRPIQVEHFDPDTMCWKRWRQQCEGAFKILKITGEDIVITLYWTKSFLKVM